MRKGSLEFWPHRRAKKQMPRFRRFAAVSEETDLGGFVAFKVGMTHISMIDDSESPSKGSEVSRAVTILEIPRLIVYGRRRYKKGYIYRQAYTEYFDLEAAKRFGIESKKDVKALKSDSAFEDVMLLVFSDSSNLWFLSFPPTGISKRIFLLLPKPRLELSENTKSITSSNAESLLRALTSFLLSMPNLFAASRSKYSV